MLLPEYAPAVVRCSEQDTRRAQVLHDVINRKYASRSTWRQSVWANEIRILCKEVGEDRVDSVIDFFVGCEAEVGFVVSSAAAFRKHFLILENKTKKGKIAVNEEELTSTSKLYLPDINARINHLIWPDSCQSEVNDFVILSLHNYDEFFYRLKAAFLSIKKSDKLYSLVSVVWSRTDTPVTHIVKWIETTHQIVHSWNAWSGSLKGFHFSVTNKHFRKVVDEWISEYTSRYAGNGSEAILNLMGYPL